MKHDKYILATSGLGQVQASASISQQPNPVASDTFPHSGEELMHLGIDFALPAGMPVRAAEAGVIARFSKEGLQNGNYIDPV